MLPLGKRIKRLREEHGLTQRQLALELNIGASTLAMYEISKRDPDTEMLIKIAKRFGVTTDYLLGVTMEDTEEAKFAAALPLPQDEQKLLDLYRKLQQSQKDAVLKITETLASVKLQEMD